MSSVKNPAGKKRIELVSDHRTFSEGKRTFRRGWRIKKSRLSKSFRQSARAALDSPAVDAEQAERMAGRMVQPPKSLKKRGIVTLDVARRLKGTRRGERFSIFNYLSQKFVRAKREQP